MNSSRNFYRSIGTCTKYFNRLSEKNYATCPHAVLGTDSETIRSEQQEQQQQHDNVKNKTAIVKPYSEVPGPKPLPILGNTWR